MDQTIPLTNDAGALFTAAALTATDNSAAYKVGAADRFGLVLDIGTVTGTSPTLDIKVQMSLDGGSTWIDHYPDDVNSQTQATMTQITASTETSKFWDRFLGRYRPGYSGGGHAAGASATPEPQVRFVLTVGGTNPSFTFTSAHLVLINYRA